MNEINNSVKSSLTDEQREKWVHSFNNNLLLNKCKKYKTNACVRSYSYRWRTRANHASCFNWKTKRWSQKYIQGILTQQQKDNMQRDIIKALPNVQNMNNELLHEIIFLIKAKYQNNSNNLSLKMGNMLSFSFIHPIIQKWLPMYV